MILQVDSLFLYLFFTASLLWSFTVFWYGIRRGYEIGTKAKSERDSIDLYDKGFCEGYSTAEKRLKG